MSPFPFFFLLLLLLLSQSQGYICLIAGPLSSSPPPQNGAAAAATKRWVSGWRGRALGEEDGGGEDGPIIIPLTGAPDRGGRKGEGEKGFLGGSFGKEGGLTIGGGGIGRGGDPLLVLFSLFLLISQLRYITKEEKGGVLDHR